MVTEKSFLIIGDILRRNAFLLNLIENCDEPYILIDCTGLLASIVDSKKLTIPNDKLKILIDEDFFVEAISNLLNFNSHLKSHLRDAVSRLRENLSINKLIERLASSSNPFIHSPSDVIYLESLIYELNTLRELDEVFDEQGFDIFADEGIKLVVDLSKITNNYVKKLVTLLLMFRIAHERNKNAELSLFIEGPEGRSLIGSISLKEILLELYDRLLLNDVALYFSSNYREVDSELITRFRQVYFIINEVIIMMNGLEASEFNSMNSINGKMKLKVTQNLEKFSFIEREYLKKQEYKRKSMLELLFGDRSDLIADVLLAMEKNLISRKEFNNLVLSFGFFGEGEKLLNELIKEDLIEERIIGGMKKITVSSKGLFLAKSHKQR